MNIINKKSNLKYVLGILPIFLLTLVLISNNQSVSIPEELVPNDSVEVIINEDIATPKIEQLDESLNINQLPNDAIAEEKKENAIPEIKEVQNEINKVVIDLNPNIDFEPFSIN